MRIKYYDLLDWAKDGKHYIRNNFPCFQHMQKSLILKTQRKGAKAQRTQKGERITGKEYLFVSSFLSRLYVKLDDTVIRGWERALYLSEILTPL